MIPVILEAREQEAGQNIPIPPDLLSRPLREDLEVLLAEGPRELPLSRNQDDPPAVRYSIVNKGDDWSLLVDTNYFVGIDWIIPRRLALRIRPKLDVVPDSQTVGEGQQAKEVDTLRMLRSALVGFNNPNDLDGLFEVDFSTPALPLLHDAEGLGLFVAAAYLATLSRIVRKGLRKQFYTQTDAFYRKLKGSVLFSPTLSQRRSNRIADRLICRHQEFGVDTLDNRILKRALRIVLAQLQRDVKHQPGILELIETARVLLRGFEAVSDAQTTASDAAKLSKITNPVFRDYRAALKLAEKILRLETLSCDRHASRRTVPVFWINMAKLFELYVYAKLRIFFPSEGTLHYQFSANHQYLDFLCTAKDRCFAPSLAGFFIADAKYKPRYAEGNVAIVDDMRQLAGYARLAGVRDECRRRGWDDRSGDLPGVILYADPNAPTTLDWHRLEPIRGWEQMFKIGLGVPAKSAE